MNWTIGGGVQVFAAGACLLLLAAAAIGDVRRYRISNRLVGTFVICFAVFAITKASWIFFGWSLAAASCIFVLAAALFAFGLLGGGDVKLMAAMTLWTQFYDLPRFMVVTTAFGGLLSVAWMIRRRRLWRADNGALVPAASALPDSASQQSARAVADKLPYGVAIAIGGFDFFLFSANSPLAGLLSGQ